MVRSDRDVSLPCIIPAAGRSARMGKAKQLLAFAGSTVLDRILDKVIEGGFAPIFLVVGGPYEPALRTAFSGQKISIVTNPAPEPGGMITSIRCGLKALVAGVGPGITGESLNQSINQDLPYQIPGFDPLPSARIHVPGFLLHPSDFPAVSAATYKLLFDAIHAAPEAIIVPICRRGQSEHQRDNATGKGINPPVRTHHGGWKRGHPVWFPSATLHAFMQPLPGGARELLRIYSDLITEIPVEDPGVLLNVDTPANYAQLSRFEP